jgi:hypothetical protein
MPRALPLLLALLAAGPASAADPKPNALTPQEVADGWLLLFDGESTFGWKTEGDVAVKDGAIVVGGSGEARLRSVAEFPAPVEVVAEWKWAGEGVGFFGFGGTGSTIPGDRWTEHRIIVTPDGAEFRSESKTRLPGGEWKASAARTKGQLNDGAVFCYVSGRVASIRSVKVRPLDLKPLFNGKDLAGWKLFAGDPKRMASKAEVTKAGELSLKGGPGDLQTEKEFADFVLQLECKTNGKGLNGGVFFRCLPGQYQQGYEAQIHNAYVGDDRTKPLDFGTGAVYRRVPARKVVSDDDEWFTLTVVADGPHISTWVNGYPTVSWADDRKPAANARQGLKLGKGHISLQGHDPTTDLLFRNIRLAEIKKD